MAALSVSVNLQNPVIVGFERQWSVLSSDSWDGEPNTATSIDGVTLQAHLTSEPDLEWVFGFDWRAIVAEEDNEYVYASEQLTLSDPDTSFNFLAASNREADVLIQVNGSALGRYDRVPSNSSFYDVA